MLKDSLEMRAEDEKKLLCVFIYSAYASGYCGRNLDSQTREDHMNMYRLYIRNQSYFPEEEIRETQAKMMEEVGSTSIRDYIYGGHQQVVVSRINEELGIDFDEMKNTPITLMLLHQCAVSVYYVIRIEEGSIKVRDISSNQEKTLRILEGLDVPDVGDVVSAHWDYYLEKVDEAKFRDAYIKYIKKLK